MSLFQIRHATTYRYANPVRLGRHRLMFRPHDSHDLRLVEARLTMSPPSTATRWLHDVFGNSVALVDFDGTARELSFISEIRLEHFPSDLPAYALEDYARSYPFSYSAEEIPDLGRTVERHYPDPEHHLDDWVKERVAEVGSGGLVETLPLLERMTQAIHDGFTYQARDAEGTQTPQETLARGAGSCRDYALLMMEAARSLGLAARFVSGYLYDPAADGGGGSMFGGGATHAWLQIYLPGVGWAEFDPTNGIVGGLHLIRVAVTRDPSQAVPVSGQWFGKAADYLGMTVEVTVTAQ